MVSTDRFSLNKRRKIDPELDEALKKEGASSEVSHAWVNERIKKLGNLLTYHLDLQDTLGSWPMTKTQEATLGDDRCFHRDPRSAHQKKKFDDESEWN